MRRTNLETHEILHVLRHVKLLERNLHCCPQRQVAVRLVPHVVNLRRQCFLSVHARARVRA
jgi:hypothetical protein